MVHWLCYHHQQPNYHDQNLCQNPNPQRSGRNSPLLREFKKPSGTRRCSMRRNRSGLIVGEGQARITRRKNSGLLSSQITQVSLCVYQLVGGDAKFVADPEFDPAKAARDERKARIAKNEKQRLRNIEHSKSSQAQTKDERKTDIEKTLVTSRVSTASMGK